MKAIIPIQTMLRSLHIAQLDALAWTARRLAQGAACYGVLGLMGMFMGVCRLLHHAAAGALQRCGWTLLSAPEVPSAHDATIAALVLVWGACSAASGHAAIAPLKRAHRVWRWRSRRHHNARLWQTSRLGG